MIETLDQQSLREYEAFRAYETDLGRHIYLRALQDTNEILFYRLLLDHIEEMLPILYTPTVGQACQQFSHIYRRTAGCSSPIHTGTNPHAARNRPTERWTSSWSRTASGSSASAIKASAAWASRSASSRCTPSSEVSARRDAAGRPGRRHQQPGTANDPEYLGWRHERVPARPISTSSSVSCGRSSGTAGDASPVGRLRHAPRPSILEQYRDQALTFNDDIQGTAAVTLGAYRPGGVTGKRLSEQQVVFLGAGSAAIGVADYLRAAMVQDGLSARGPPAVLVRDKDGLLHTGRSA